MDKNKIIKYVRNFALFVGLIILTFWIIFKDQDKEEFIQILKNSSWKFILIGTATMFAFLCLEAVNIGRMLKHLGEKSCFLRNLKYALIGFFFSAITPAASGGQPMQIYYMHKDGISIGSSTLTLLLNITCVIFVTITLSLFNLIFNYQYMDAGLAAFFIFGTLLNSCAVALFLIAIFSEKTLDKMVGFTKNILNKLRDRAEKKLNRINLPNTENLIERLNEKHQKRINKLDEQLTKYKENAQIIRKNKKIILKTLLIYYFQYTLYYLISYWAYRAIGLNKHTWFEVASLQSIVYATVSGIPSPGAVGVSEAAYLGLFKNVIPVHLINSVTLLVRLMNFYLFVAISGIVVVVTAFRVSRRDNKKTDNY